MEKISVIFVLPREFEDESQASEIMLQAFEACKQNKVNTTWVKEQDIYKTELKKTDFIVFENFEGKNFESIQEKKSASILGPWCVLICLMEGKKIPNFQWPIFNVAMYGCIVTTTLLPKNIKMQISEKVQRMGGYYIDALSENTTHLIADSVKSAKYLKAIELKVKVLTPSWIDAVWEASQEANIHCNDHQFNKYKCLPLHKLLICTTGISTCKEREEVQKMITDNGGEYTGRLNLKTTDFLICEGDAGAMSKKYKEARKTENVTCVTLQWLHDSIKNGYCVPHHEYVVRKSTSTPQKSDYINPNFSTISAIDQTKCERTSIDDTILKNSYFGSASSTPTNGVKRKVFTECDNLIEQIDIKKAKRSGQFLDGCSIYLVGFKDDHREKLCKIINASGATRCDDMSDRVTHVIVGDPESHELKLIKSKSFSCAIVTLQWLLDSIERKRPCGEDSYLVNNLRDESKFKSPLGKKGLSLLRSNRTITEIDLTNSQKEKENLEDEIDLEAEKEIMKQYMMPECTEEDSLANLLKEANFDSKRFPNPQSQSENKLIADVQSTEETTYTSQTSSQVLEIFRGLSFFVIGFDDEQVASLQETIEGVLGSMSLHLKDANYVVAPCFITKPLDYDKDITINDLWIYDCITKEEILPIKYYHHPLLIKNPSVLEDCVVTLSGYSGYERNFLSSLIVILGGVSQEQFCRITSVEKNVLGSTHLVTAEASGKKYAGALKWHLPAVDKEWLIGCANSETKLPEEDYSVSKNSTKTDTSIPCNKSENNSNKENITNNRSNTSDSLKLTVKADSTRLSTKDVTETSRKSSDSSKNIPSMGVFSKLNINETDEHSETIRNASDVMAQISEACSKSSKNRPKASLESVMNDSRSNRNDEVGGDDSFAYTFKSEENDSGTTSRTVVEVQTPKGPDAEDSFTIPPPRKLGSIGGREPRTPKSRDPYRTPDNKVDDVFYSQVTPVVKIMSEVRLTNLLGTPESPQLPRAPWDVDTPETPYGAYLDPNPSKSLKKDMLRFLNRFPDKTTPIQKKRLSTPLSELKRRLWDKIGSNYESQSQIENLDTSHKEDQETEKESSTQSALVNTRLQQLEEIMAAATGSANKSRRQSKVTTAVPEPASEFNMRESQPCTVQWDFGKDTQEEPAPKSKIFMISGIGDMNVKASIISSLKELGAIVSETSSYDATATHLLCPKPARNEKTLSCMAAGRWILHTNYVDACVKAGKFLNEEEYEFGNPNSIGKISIELDRDIGIRMQAIHYWRNEIARTGRGPFRDMRAIIVAERKQGLLSVIEAGGGSVIDATPPFHDTIHATHCLIEPKSVTNFSQYEPLAKQGIYCVNTVYLSDYLHRINGDIKDSILPFYQKYF